MQQEIRPEQRPGRSVKSRSLERKPRREKHSSRYEFLRFLLGFAALIVFPGTCRSSRRISWRASSASSLSAASKTRRSISTRSLRTAGKRGAFRGGSRRPSRTRCSPCQARHCFAAFYFKIFSESFSACRDVSLSWKTTTQSITFDNNVRSTST